MWNYLPKQKCMTMILRKTSVPLKLGHIFICLTTLLYIHHYEHSWSLRFYLIFCLVENINQKAIVKFLVHSFNYLHRYVLARRPLIDQVKVLYCFSLYRD